VALWVNDRLVEYREEHRHVEPLVGALIQGRVTRVLPSLEAAWVDYGEKTPGFLPLDEVTSEAVSAAGATKASAKSLKVGQSVLVQITKLSVGTKGARLTGKFSLPGRYWVYLPCGAPEVLVARKHGDKSARAGLRAMFEPLLEARGGLVLRSTAPVDAPETLHAELEELRARWDEILQTARDARSGEVVYRDHALPLRALREQVSRDCERVLVDEISLADELNAVADRLYPELRGKIEISSSSRPLFEQYGVDAQLARSAQRKILLGGGGSLVFDETEAMVVVDVNAGNPQSGTSRTASHLATNLEAAREIAHQLRLRDLTGIIVVDFISMRSESDRRNVETELKKALRSDLIRHEVFPMTALGLVQIMRSGGRRSAQRRAVETCSHCNGRGVVPTMMACATRALHQSERILVQDSVAGVELFAAQAFVDFVSQELGTSVDALSEKYRKRIVLSSGDDYHSEEYSLSPLVGDANPTTKG